MSKKLLQYYQGKMQTGGKVLPMLQILNNRGFKDGAPPEGTNWRIPGDTLYNPTPYKIKAVSDKGEVKYLNPFDNNLVKFTNAEYVDEYQMQSGGGVEYPAWWDSKQQNYQSGGRIIVREYPALQSGGFANMLRDYGQGISVHPLLMQQGGEMIRRADGSYSRRGLWDNIRANKGSGKKPTKQMLEQERKIKSKNS